MRSYSDYSATAAPVTRPPPSTEEATGEKKKKKHRKKHRDEKKPRRKHRSEAGGATILQTDPNGFEPGMIGEMRPRPSPVQSAGLTPVWNPSMIPTPTPEQLAAKRESELRGLFDNAPPPTTIDPQERVVSSDRLLQQYQRNRDAEARELESMTTHMGPPEETIECGLGSTRVPAGPTATDLGKWREEELDRLAEIQHRVANDGEQQNYYY